MASGHVNRIKRPNTWLHRPMLQNVKKALANTEPSTHGAKRPFAVETSGDRRFGSARRCSTFTTWARPGSELILEKIQADLVAHLPVRPRVASRALSARRFDWQRAPPTRSGLS